MHAPELISSSVTNAAAYHFAHLTELPALRLRLQAYCRDADLRGTILLSTEGVNLFVAGGQREVESLLAELRLLPGVATLRAKFSSSATQPFRRMLVKIKKEIIAFGVDSIDPIDRPAPRIAPLQLKQWLDEGRDIVLLDTRNDYEIKLGTFRNATTVGVDHFRNFPVAVEKLPSDFKDRVVVSFCTGGIRCEKAAPYLIEQGFRQVYQLDGGILKYFEDCGNAHYDGDCFVFDQRVGLDPALAPAPCERCSNCQDPIVESIDNSTNDSDAKLCVACRQRANENIVATLAARQNALVKMITPLPGAGPYDNYRPIKISVNHDKLLFRDALSEMFPHLPAQHWQLAFSQGRIVRKNLSTVDSEHIVRAGERYYHWLPGTCEPVVNAAIEFLWEDDALIVINKPAPLPMHPSGRFNRNTVSHILNEIYAPDRPRLCHRLDSNTTGVAVLAKTKHAANYVQQLFERGLVKKRYLARVHGHPISDEFSSSAAISARAGVAGSRTVDDNGIDARTDFTVLIRHSDGTCLVQARPVTGRTNQIRIHLWQLGHPIVGDQTYLMDGRHGDTQTVDVDDAPLCLHAHEIDLLHPAHDQPRTFTAPVPTWAKE
jgi:UPF0176 protein